MAFLWESLTVTLKTMATTEPYKVPTRKTKSRHSDYKERDKRSEDGEEVDKKKTNNNEDTEDNEMKLTIATPFAASMAICFAARIPAADISFLRRKQNV